MHVVGVCNYNPDTTVLAHINTDGSIMGGKSSDLGGVYACYDCHTWLDQNKGSEIDRLFYTRRAIIRTINKMLEDGIIKI